MKKNRNTEEFKKFIYSSSVKNLSGEEKTNKIKQFWGKKSPTKRKGKSRPEIGLGFKRMRIAKKKVLEGTYE